MSLSISEFDSAAYATARGALDDWEDFISATFLPVEARPLARDFHAMLRATRLDLVEAAYVTGSAQTFERTSELVNRDYEDSCKLMLVERGTCDIDQEDEVKRFDTGDLCYFDCSRPYKLMFSTDFEILLLMIPRSSMYGPGFDRVFFPLMRIDDATARGRMLRVLSSRIADELRASGSDDGDLPKEVMDCIVRLAGGALGEFAHSGGIPTNPAVSQVLEYIESHLTDPRMSVEDIARANNVSTRHLQRMLASQGTTVTSWLRARRLERARTDLSDPACAYLPVATIAARWGFADLPHFNRQFKLAYGVSPGTYRRQVGPIRAS